jgi:hypothetical protein
MDVEVDQAGHEDETASVDRSVRRGSAASADSGYPAAFDEDVQNGVES